MDDSSSKNRHNPGGAWGEVPSVRNGLFAASSDHFQQHSNALSLVPLQDSAPFTLTDFDNVQAMEHAADGSDDYSTGQAFSDTPWMSGRQVNLPYGQPLQALEAQPNTSTDDTDRLNNDLQGTASEACFVSVQPS